MPRRVANHAPLRQHPAMTPPPNRSHDPRSARPGTTVPFLVLPLLILAAGCGGDGGDAPREVSFAPTETPAFEAPGSLTDAWADIDGDGSPDRFVGFNGAPARLYRNGGVAGFTDVAAELGLVVERPVRTSSWGDFDTS